MDELRQRAVESGQYFKTNAYDTAIRSVTYHTKPIRSGDEAMDLPGIGKGIAATIQEIIETVNIFTSCLSQGTLKRLKDDLEDRKAKALNLFSHIVGFGHLSAPDFVNRVLFIFKSD
jgi:hypothetical protein